MSRRSWSSGEEIAHSVSHGVGVVLAIAGLVALVAVGAVRGDVWSITTAAVYGSTLVLLYVASTLYHAIPIPPAKRVLRVLDHAAIYLLIAGTYTPIALGPLRGPWGWTLLATVWLAAIAGVIYESLALGRQPILSAVLYTALGWCVVVAFEPLLRALAPAGVVLLVAGGLCYTGGLAFYATRSLRYHHFIWHLFVLAGSILHWLAILLYVLPVGSRV